MTLVSHPRLSAFIRVQFLLLFLCVPLHAQTRVIVRDVLYSAAGVRVSGQVEISWSAFTTADAKAIAAGKVVRKITDGVLEVQLVPNAGATPSGTRYLAAYSLTDATHYSETWVVPASPSVVTLATVRVSVPPSPSIAVAQQQLTLGSGLAALLGLHRSATAPVATAAGQLYCDTTTDPCTPRISTGPGVTYTAIGSGGSTPDADATTKGKVQLAGDLGGTAAAPTVPGLAGKVASNDSRLSDARTPTAHASSHGTGQGDAITVAPAQVTGTAVVTNDSRLSDARTPTAHASSHGTGQGDAISIAHTQVSGLGGAAVLSVGTTAGTVAAGDDSRFGAGNVPSGGTTGQAMAKKSNTNYDLEWISLVPQSMDIDPDTGEVVGWGGTSIAALSGLVKLTSGVGSAAAYSDVVALFTACTGGLWSDGTCKTTGTTSGTLAAGDHAHTGYMAAVVADVTYLTMTGTLTLSASSTLYQALDPDGSDREVDLYTSGLVSNRMFCVRHKGSANTITIKAASGGATIGALTTGQIMTAIYDGSAWRIW